MTVHRNEIISPFLELGIDSYDSILIVDINDTKACFSISVILTQKMWPLACRIGAM